MRAYLFLIQILHILGNQANGGSIVQEEILSLSGIMNMILSNDHIKYQCAMMFPTYEYLFMKLLFENKFHLDSLSVILVII